MRFEEYGKMNYYEQLFKTWAVCGNICTEIFEIFLIWHLILLVEVKEVRGKGEGKCF